MHGKTKIIALLGLLASLAMVLSYIEMLLPPLYSALPGIKMGLTNIVIIFTLYKLGVKEAVTVSAIRLLWIGLLFGNVMTLAYSVAGATLSLALMALLKHFGLFSIAGVSVVGGISHNVGQIAVAIFLLERAEIGYYLIVLSLTGTVAGLLVGLASGYLLKLLKKLDFK